LQDSSISDLIERTDMFGVPSREVLLRDGVLSDRTDESPIPLADRSLEELR
jgi:hypothetical protein